MPTTIGFFWLFFHPFFMILVVGFIVAILVPFVIWQYLIAPIIAPIAWVMSFCILAGCGILFLSQVFQLFIVKRRERPMDRLCRKQRERAKIRPEVLFFRLVCPVGIGFSIICFTLGNKILEDAATISKTTKVEAPTPTTPAPKEYNPWDSNLHLRYCISNDRRECAKNGHPWIKLDHVAFEGQYMDNVWKDEVTGELSSHRPCISQYSCLPEAKPST